MRRFKTPDGAEWDATIGRESWGTFVLIFSGPAGPRKAVLSAETQLDAERELEDMTDGALNDRLAGSEPWT